MDFGGRGFHRALLGAGFAAALVTCGGGGGGSDTPGAPVIQPGIPSSANSIVVDSGTPRSDPEGVAPVSGSTSVVTWMDSRNAARTMTLYAYLYQYDFSFTDGVQNVSRSANDDAFGHEGFGYVVSHNTQTGNSPLGKANTPTDVTTTTFAGAHHAIHHIELVYDRDVEADGFGIKIPVVIEWLVATGRDHPVWSVTWKMSAASNPNAINFDDYRMDTRGPYGSLNFDGAANRMSGDTIGGVAWGDFGLKFATTDAQLTLDSPWTYNTPNSVNFTQAWTANTNAEMGIVQTKPGDKQMGYPDRVVGRERGVTSNDMYFEKQDCNNWAMDGRSYAMPCVAGWPYQLMNFDWDPTAPKPQGEATGTKLIAWGSPFGFVGATNADLFDFSGTVDATGDRSYAAFIVLGPHCRFAAGVCDQDGEVTTAVKAVEALGAATISAVGPGTLPTTLPLGPGSSQTKTVANGYNDTYAAYTLDAAADQVAFTFTPAAPVKNPMFVIRNFSLVQVPTVKVNDVAVSVNDGTAGSGAFASVDIATQQLWITLNRTLTATTTISVGP